MVTGAGRGVGRAVARALAGRGVHTALVARRLQDVEAVSRDLREEGAVALPLRGDLSDPAAAAGVVAAAADALGPVDLLVNNAASIGPLGATAGVSVTAWAAALQLNLVAALGMIAAVLPGMLERGFGRIVNVSSGAASGSGMLQASAYSASKAGLEMLTRNLAAELAGGPVAVAAVRPGRVDTDMQRMLRSQDPAAAGTTVVDRAWSFLNEGQLLDPAVPARLILRVLERGLSGSVVSVYDEQGRALLSDIRYVGDGS